MSFSSRHSPRVVRHTRLRQKLIGTPERPRLAVFVSNRHFYAQIIDDLNHRTLISFSTIQLKKPLANNLKTAILIGTNLAKMALAKKTTTIVFDRGGFLYHGRIAAFATAVRKGGLKF